jgi:hypothetical protein
MHFYSGAPMHFLSGVDSRRGDIRAYNLFRHIFCLPSGRRAKAKARAAALIANRNE